MAKTDREQKMRLAAYLRGMLHLAEAHIGIRLGGISTPAVCALLKKAREAGLLEEQIVYKGGELSPADDDALYNFTFQSELRSRIVARMKEAGRHNAPRVYLYDLRADGGNDIAVQLRIRYFAERAAPELRRLLTRPSVKTIGVAWGGGIAAAGEALAAERLPSRTGNPVTVVALCGEPLDHRPTNESSSAIAENLSLALNGTRAHARTLGITPAYIPASEPSARDCVWLYIVSTAPYREVFGAERLPAGARPGGASPTPPLCESLDTFLTSVSIEGGTLGYGNNKIYRPEFLDPREIEPVVFGDMGGIPLPRPNLSSEQLKVLREIEGSWTGVTRKHVQDCVAKGFAGHPTVRPPGCILVAVGEQKARTVYQAAVQEGLVNHLFIDYGCAQALDILLKQSAKAAA